MILHKQHSNNVYKTLLNTIKYHADYYKLEKCDKGWFELQPILKIVRKHHPEHKYLTVFDVKHMIVSDMKKRLEMSKDMKSIKLAR